jgi:hypothetical protein
MRIQLKYFLDYAFFPVVDFSQSDSTLVPVEFDFYKVSQPTENGVGVYGSFNNWRNNPDGTGNNPHLIPFANIGNNNWKGVANKLLGKYEYKFVTYSLSANGNFSISSWITDPLNSNFGEPYNNSRLTAANSMIYYLLLLNDIITNNPQTISAKISWAKTSLISLSTIKLFIDNNLVSNVRQYFNMTSRTFSYTQTQPFTYTKHSAELPISNNTGSNADAITSFNISNAITKASYTFIFDPSPNVKILRNINSVEIKYTFDTVYTYVILSEGVNKQQPSVDYLRSLKSYSTKVYFNRIINHKPQISIIKNIVSGSVTFDAFATTNYDQLIELFNWFQDLKNPQKVIFSTTSAASTGFSVPQKHGEYFYTLRVNDFVGTKKMIFLK